MNAEPPIRAAAAASAQGSDFTMPKLNRKGQPHKGTPRRRVKPKNKNVNVNVNELKPAPQPEQKSIYGSRQERKKAQNNRRKAKKYAIRRRIWRRNTATCLFSVVLLRSGPIYAPIWTPIHNPIHNVSYCNKVLSLLKLAHQPTLRQNSEHKFEVLQYKYKMEIDLTEYQRQLSHYLDIAASKFHQIPGSAIFLRYIRSSYQNDPVRSAIELVLVIFFLRYLISPSYSTQRTNFVKLTEEEIDELVDEWQPEPLTADLTEFEEEVREKLPVIVG